MPLSVNRILRTLPMTVSVLGAVARPFTPEDLVQTNRLGDTVVSPGNTAVAYIRSQYSIDSKRQTTKLLVQSLSDNSYYSDSPIDVVDHSADARVNPPKEASDAKGEDVDEPSSLKKKLKPSQPVWLSDSVLGFVAPDTSSSGSILYAVSERKGRWSKPHPLVSMPVPISSVQFSPESGILAFTADVYNGTTTLEDTASIDRQEQERADTARVYEDLWVRHWDTFTSPKLPQIHTLKLVSTSDNSFKPKGQPRNIIKDTEADGRLEASDSFVFSPNGLQVAFVAKKPGKDYAWKTTSFVYLADVDGSAAVPINPGNGGASSSPSFNHDGTKIAYVQMAAPTYEADRNQIKIYDIAEKTTTNVAADWDRSPGQVKWDDDSTLLVTYNEYGHNKLSKVDIATGNVTSIIANHAVSSFKRLAGTDKLLINYSALDAPNNLYTVSTDGSDLARVTNANPELGNSIELSVPEDVEFVGADNATIHGFLLRPPQFDASKKYPLAFVIHGGPQLSFLDAWSPRWNLNIFAAAGFVTVALDPQGSTGYGQEFTDAIRNQWGGKPYNSLMMSLEQLLETHTYIDRNRMAALGASYGGYMINWINGHTDVFRALVNHDGMFSTIGTYYSTEELYFPETEFEGIPSDNEARKNYERWSPERFVQNWKTPTLVIHSEKDYRLVVSEGLSTFTALRRQNVPAKFLYFPDENHWVLKPANSLRWHHEVLSWVSKWTNDGEAAESDSHIENADAKFHIQNEHLDI
ncbi:dipeptidylpeptidase [Coemansia sp. RSA 1813]|nr:dipeptidylpeptidase [Coemansia sp. RSA 1843]KAJ2091391.1 dipeptidylpeptidase [Coemansia sp. RSA 986]KAJ2212852.1 dipeptidylpeptidase [Coemansia sp. RSA 487]KAJ2569553.1 dipeptidylpeptidase [Coemansia sp. RSA 1813]